MNKLSKMILGVAVSAMVLSGCKNQEVVAPTVTNPNQFPNGVVQKRIAFTVQVSPSFDGGKAEGLSGVVVTVSQNGTTASKTTGTDGLAVFDNLYEGYVAIYASASGYAARNVNTYIEDNSSAVIGNNGNNTNQTVPSSDSYQLTLDKTGAAVVGTLFGNFNTSNLTLLSAGSGLRLKATVSSNPSSYQPNTFYTTVASDGSFKFTGLIDKVGFTISLDTTIGKVRYTAETSITPSYGQTVSTGQLTASASNGEVLTNSSVKGLLYGAFTLVSVGGFNGTTPVFATTLAAAANQPVVLKNTSTGLTFTTTTDGNGNFSFGTLPEGSYELKTVKSVSYNYTQPGTTLSYTTTQDFTYSTSFDLDGTNTAGSGALDLQTKELGNNNF